MARLLSRLRENAPAKSSRTWDAVYIKAGESLNGRPYTAPRLKAAVERGLFDNRAINLYRKVDASGRVTEDHLGPADLVGRSLKNAVGVTGKARFEEATGEVRGPVRLFETGSPDADWLAQRLDELERMGAMDSVELSIEGAGEDPDGLGVELDVVHSVDVVSFAAAGGRIGNRIAASRTFGGHPMKSLLHKRLREAAATAALVAGLADSLSAYGLATHLSGLVKADATKGAAVASALGIDAKRVTESKPDDLGSVIGEAVLEEEGKLQAAAAAAAAKPPAPPAPTPDPRLTESENKLVALERKLALVESNSRLASLVGAAGLPAPAAKRLTEAHKETVLDAAAASRIVEAEKAHVDELARALGEQRVQTTREPQVRLTEALAHMLNPQQVKAPAEGAEPWFGSIRGFIERHFLPGNLRIQEAAGNIGVGRRIREAIDSTNFDQVFEDALRRSALAAYQGHANYSTWRKIVRVVPYSDFRTHRVIQMGYYGNLNTVTKGAPYLALTTPSDREQTIALAKKGGLEEILMEDILNDDLSLFQTMQKRLGQAAMETAFETVFALIRDATQPTMVDTYTLTSTSRSPVNEGTAAMSADATGKTNFVNSIIAMMKGTGGSGVKKGVIPRYCVIPFEKSEAFAYIVGQLRAGLTGSDVKDVLGVLGAAIPEPIIDYGTSNATDHYFIADPNQAEVLRFGTLGGREEPEIFLADDQRFGSLFTHDKVQLKIRFIYAAAAMDSLGIYGNDAAS